ARAGNQKSGSPIIFAGAFLRDGATIVPAVLSAIMAAVFLFGPPASLWAILLGAIGAMLPDPLRFVHRRLPHEPLRTLQRFHRWAHTDSQIKGLVLGFGTQAVFVAIVVGLTIAAHRGAFDFSGR